MYISEKIKELEFTGNTMKAAYLNACKWLSTNVIAINNSNHMTYKFEKVESKFGQKKIKLILYATADESELYERNCDICQETSSMFYLNKTKAQCQICKISPYRRRLTDKLELIKKGMKGTIL